MLKRTISLALGLLLCALALPLLLIGGAGKAEETAASPTQITRTAPPTAEPTPGERSEPPLETETPPDGQADANSPLKLYIDGQTVELTMSEYLPMALAAEMPASFEVEALKAQAVALRTYARYCAAHPRARHPDAHVCGDAYCCQAYTGEAALREKWGESYSVYMSRLRTAVLATDGEYLSWQGEAILAAFHSSSAGRTEDSGSLWSNLPYLMSVSSPETAELVPNYVSTVDVSAEDFRRTVSAKYPDAELSGEPSGWLGDSTLTGGGRVERMYVGGAAIDGGQLRELFGLRSAAFTLGYSDGAFRFTVTGFGHGIGMSQYGANAMALEGADYREILAHYYTGSELTK